MSRVSGCLWLGVALILALVTGGVAFVTLQKASAAKAEGSVPVATSSVVVAAHPVPIGALLTEQDLTTQTLPASALPAGAVTAVSTASGQLTMVPLEAGEMVLQNHLTHPDITGSNLSFTLPEGLVGVTLSADDLLSQVGVLKSGDHVDLLYSMPVSSNSAGSKNGEKTQYTFGTLQNVTVVSVVASAVTDKAQSGAAQSATVAPARAYILALEPQEALVLKYLKDAGAIMDLAVRNLADEGDHKMNPVDMQYLIDKYELREH